MRGYQAPSWRESSQLVGGRKGAGGRDGHATQKEEGVTSWYCSVWRTVEDDFQALEIRTMALGNLLLKKKLEQTIQNNHTFFLKKRPFLFVCFCPSKG